MIEIQLLGGACLRADGKVIGGPPAQRHRLALLTLIVDAWPHPITRDRALALLWPERDETGGRRLLNLAVHVLRTTLGEGVVASVSDGLVFEPSAVECDLHRLRQAIDSDDADGVVRRYTGPLLEGFHLADSAEFAQWLDGRRSELARAYEWALVSSARRQQAAGDTEGLIATCRRLTAADPQRAEYAERLMRALADAGDRAGALRHAAEYTRRVQVELEMEPDPRVTSLADELRRSAPARRAGAVPPPARTVAVLPFRNLGGEPRHEYFADGITDDVIAHLSKIRALSVISRSSAMACRDHRGSVRDLGRALGAGSVVDGTVRYAGERVRIVATLVDVETDRQLWAETYDRQLTDIFTIQTDVALQIARALETGLSADERARVQRRPTTDLTAYQLFLQGRRLYIAYTAEGQRAAVECYERAILRDSAFGLAYAHLAIALTESVESGFVAPHAAYPKVNRAIRRALELEPDLGAVHLAAAHAEVVQNLGGAIAERHFLRALELSPGDADAYNLYGRYLSGVERHDEAIAMLRRAQELDPIAHRMDLATALIRADRYDEAIAQAQAGGVVDIGRDRARATLGWAYFLSGRREEGLAELEAAAAIDPTNPSWLAQLGEARGLAGDAAGAREVLRRLDELGRTSFVSPYHRAYVHVGLGELDRAVELVEAALAERSAGVYGIRGSFLFRPLREHPKFRALMASMPDGGA
jgi:TolB-like protein/Flp pilus assembly protein TadD